MKVYMTKVFQNGGSQAVRIPADLRFEEGAEVHIFRGPNGEVCIKDTPPKGSLAALALSMLAGKVRGAISDEKAAAWMDQVREDRAVESWGEE